MSQRDLHRPPAERAAIERGDDPDNPYLDRNVPSPIGNMSSTAPVGVARYTRHEVGGEGLAEGMGVVGGVPVADIVLVEDIESRTSPNGAAA